MKSTRENIANNICVLRKKWGYTQSQLAEKLNYTDKAVSKWERGETTPDVDALASLSRIFGVSVDYLFREHQDSEVTIQKHYVKKQLFQMCTLLTATLLIPLVIYVFVLMKDAKQFASTFWLGFIWMLPVMGIIVTYFLIKLKKPIGYLISESFVVWTLLAASFLTGFILGYNIWMVFLIGIPLEMFICFKNLLSSK